MTSWHSSCSKANVVIVAATLMSLKFTACAHTVLPAQVVAPAPVGSAKLSIKVAVLSDPSLTLHEPLGFYEKLNPALANAVRDALAADFERVAVVGDTQATDDADLLAIPDTTEVRYVNKRPEKLVVRFVEPKTGNTLAAFSSTRPIDSEAPGTRAHLGADLAVSGLEGLIPVLGPAFFYADPTVHRHESERFNAAFSPALDAMVTDIATQASKDQAIASLSIHQPPTQRK